ncbi:MAG: dihydropteroate synthase, partial [Thermoplasmata archaeon]
MHRARCLVIDDEEDARILMDRLGAHPKGLEIMAPKAVHFNIYLENIPNVLANILKQEMLSLGGDACVRKDTIYGGDKEYTDVILIGNLKQFRLLAKKLEIQPLGLKEIGLEILDSIKNYTSENKKEVTQVGKTKFEWGNRTYIMGILNLTPDSFSGDGILDINQAVDRAKKMVDDGADIIDVGGESSRPGAQPISVNEEKKRVLPVIEKLAHELDGKALISIDTYKYEVAKEAVAIKVNGLAKDLNLPINENAKIEILTFDSKEGKEIFW